MIRRKMGEPPRTLLNGDDVALRGIAVMELAMTARGTTERHAQDVVDRNLERIVGDVAGLAFSLLVDVR
jgi:hypothetical protein